MPKITQDQYVETTQRIVDTIRCANWGIRGVARALETNDLNGCMGDDDTCLSVQAVVDLHHAALSLSQYIDSQVEWFDTATIIGGEV